MVFILYYIILPYIILYYIILYYIILYYIILYYIILYYIILYYIILWDHRRICGPLLTETSLCDVRNSGDNRRHHLGADCLSAEGIHRVLFNSSLWVCYSIPDGKTRSAGSRHIHGGRHFGAECQLWGRELCCGAGAVLREGVQPGVQTGKAAPAAADAGVAIHTYPGSHRSDSHRSAWHPHLQAGSVGHWSSGLLPIWTRTGVLISP